MNRFVNTLAALAATFSLTACNQDRKPSSKVIELLKKIDADLKNNNNVGVIKEYKGYWFVINYREAGKIQDIGILDKERPSSRDLQNVSSLLKKSVAISEDAVTDIEKSAIEQAIKHYPELFGVSGMVAENQPARTSITHTLS